jgi:thiamine-monophosphate kinase
MNPKDLLFPAAMIELPYRRKFTVMSVCCATGRRFRMKQERQLVEKILRALPSFTASSFPRSGLRKQSEAIRLGPGDDAAVLSPSGETDLVLSCDAFIEGVHFRTTTHPPASVGYKALARATSDLAAMGATPRHFLLTLALPKTRSGIWLDDFLKGMARAARELAIVIIGGDTTVAEAVSISITVLGEMTRGTAVPRSGALPGDLIYVSGKLGRAQLGLELVLGGQALNPEFRSAVRPHLCPKIQIKLGAWLAQRHIATAMMDISDGLSTDLTRLSEASKVGARIYANKIPQVAIPAATAKKLSRGSLDPLQMALHGGEDYELLFTVSREKAKLLRGAPNFSRLVAIGEITTSKKLLLIDVAGRGSPLKPLGWDPF